MRVRTPPKPPAAPSAQAPSPAKRAAPSAGAAPTPRDTLEAPRAAPVAPLALQPPARPHVFSTSAIDAADGAATAALLDTAKRALSSNIHSFDGKSYLSAGKRQFKGLWTRDFAWSTRGLLAMGRADVVKDQVELLLSKLRPGDHLLPRSLDSLDTKLRVAMATVHELIPLVPGELGISKHLKPEYIDQYGQTAFDGNMLVVLAAKQYVDATGDTAFWAKHRPQLVEALRYYEAHSKDGLLQQPPYSDWQDSVKREGASFYSNMLYAHVLEQVAGDPAFPRAAEQARALRAKVDAVFKDPQTGLYRSMEKGPQVSLDGNLLALDLGYVKADSAEGRALYAALKKSPLWQAGEGPGFTTWPPYPDDEKSPMQKLIGLGGYHDTLYWSWEMALAAKVAGQMGDGAQARAILGRLEAVARRDGTIAEVYAPKPGLPVEKTPLYRSEMPFSWGSAFVIDAITSLKSRP